MGRKRLTILERERRRLARVRFSFSNDAYKHYDPTTEGFGSVDEWTAQAERVAQGRGTYQRPAGARSAERITPDMKLLGLLAMPITIDGLKSAMRKVVLKLHPDRGGDATAFKAAWAAYERLVRFY
jgi:hypothetical protein